MVGCWWRSPRAIAPASANWGNPLATSQPRFGAHNTSASSPASQGHGERNARRGPATSTPSSKAASSTAGSSLFSSPTPATRPTSSQPRPPSRSERTTSQVIKVHTNRSMMVVDNVWPTISSTLATAMAPAASTWAPRAAPNSRAINPVTRTIRPLISADGIRSPTSEPWNTTSRACASSGASGGWST